MSFPSPKHIRKNISFTLFIVAISYGLRPMMLGLAAENFISVDIHNFLTQHQMTSTTRENFRPTAILTKAELAKFSYQFANKVLHQTPGISNKCIFQDKSDYQSQQYAIKVCQLGIMGVDNEGKALKKFDYRQQVSKKYFFDSLLKIFHSDKSMPESLSTQLMTRGQAAYIFYMLDQILRQKGLQQPSQSTDQSTDQSPLPPPKTSPTKTPSNRDDPGSNTPNTIIKKPTLEVRFTNPSQDYIPSTSSANKIGKLILSAPKESITLQSITFTLDSPSAKTHISHITLWDEYNKRIADQKIFDNSYRAKLAFLKPLTIVAGQSKELHIILGTQFLQNNIFQLSIKKSSDIATTQDIDIVGTLYQNYNDTSSSPIQPEQTTQFIPNNPSQSNILNADQETVVGAIELTCLYDDCLVKELVLLNVAPDFNQSKATNSTPTQKTLNGTVINIYQDNKLIRSTTMANGIISLNFQNPILLSKGEEKSFLITAKALRIASEDQSNHTIKLVLLEPGSVSGQTTYKTTILSKANGKEIDPEHFTTQNVSNQAQYVRKSHPILTSQSPSNTLLLTSQSKDIYGFMIQSTKSNKMLLKEIRRDIYLEGNLTLDDFSLSIDANTIESKNLQRSKNDTQNCSQATTFTRGKIQADGSNHNACLRLIFVQNYENGYVISSSKNITLHADITTSPKSSLSTTINQISNSKSQQNYATASNGATSLIRSDDAYDKGSTTTSVNRFTDSLILHLPLSPRIFSQ